jgi:hypothetical protein
MPLLDPEEDGNISDFDGWLIVQETRSFDGGTRGDYQWRAGVYDQGPFYSFLGMHPWDGLRLINQIVNHTTSWWRRCKELDQQDACTPLPQEVYLPNGKVIELWGDGNVYMWSSTGLCKSKATVCALRALEK